MRPGFPSALPLSRHEESASLALCFLLGLGAFASYYAFLKQGQPNLLNDSYEYAQVARSVAQGRGLVTHTATVLELDLLGRWGLPLPYFFHDVGNTLLLALFFKLFGATDSVVGWTSGAFYVLLIPLTLVIGSRLFGLRTGVLAAALVLVNPQLLVFSATGYSEVPYAFFLTLLLLLIYSQRSRVGVFAAGVVYGWLTVLRSNSLPFLPFILLYYVVSGESKRAQDAAARPVRSGLGSMAAFLLGAAVLMVPNALRNWEYLGNPLQNVNSIYTLVWYTSAIQTKGSDVFSSPRLNFEPSKFILDHPAELPRKMRYQLAKTIPALLRGGTELSCNWADAILLFVLVLGVLAPPPQTFQLETFRRLVYALMLVAVFVGSMFSLRWRHLYGFIPVMLVLDAELFVRFLSAGNPTSPGSRVGMGLRGLLLVFALGALGVGPVVASIRPARGVELNNFYKTVGTFLRQSTPQDAVILTQAGSSTPEVQNGISWYAPREYLQLTDSTRTMVAGASSAPLYILMTQNPLNAEAFDPRSSFEGFEPAGVLRDALREPAALLFVKK